MGLRLNSIEFWMVIVSGICVHARAWLFMLSWTRRRRRRRDTKHVCFCFVNHNQINTLLALSLSELLLRQHKKHLPVCVVLNIHVIVLTFARADMPDMVSKFFISPRVFFLPTSRTTHIHRWRWFFSGRIAGNIIFIFQPGAIGCDWVPWVVDVCSFLCRWLFVRWDVVNWGKCATTVRKPYIICSIYIAIIGSSFCLNIHRVNIRLKCNLTVHPPHNVAKRLWFFTQPPGKRFEADKLCILTCLLCDQTAICNSCAFRLERWMFERKHVYMLHRNTAAVLMCSKGPARLFAHWILIWDFIMYLKCGSN